MGTRRSLTVLFAAGCLNAGVGLTQEYPARPVRIITVQAGGGSDFAARTIAPGLAAALGQPVIVDNRIGAILASELASKASPDGYSLLVQGAALWVNALLRPMPFDITDFAPITQITREASLFVVHPSVPANSVKEFIALAKAKPGVLNYGSTGVGGPQHLGAELLRSMTGIDIVHVPYKGTAPALTALIGAQVQLMITDAGGAAPHVKSGKLRALAATSSEPSLLFPTLPTVAATVPGYELVGITGIYAPVRTPAVIVNRLNRDLVRVIAQTEVKERFLASGSEPVGNSQQQFVAVIKADTARKSKVIKDAGIKAE